MSRRPTPALRRIKVTLIVALVLISMTIGWISDRAHQLFHYLIAKCGLIRIEDWLRGRSIWFASVLFVVLACGFVRFKEYEITLLVSHHIAKALSLGLVFKVTYLGLLNYLLHIYAELFLAIGWIKRLYDRYVELRSKVISFIKRTGAYHIAHAIKLRFAAFARRPSLFRAVKKWYAKRG